MGRTRLLHGVARQERCEVVVGNIGTVYDGRKYGEARRVYDEYVSLSRSPHGGRAAGEPVTFLVGGEIEDEHNP